MDYFVTGATGLVGRHLVARLVERGGTVFVLVRVRSQDRLARLLPCWRGPGSVVPLYGDVSEPGLGIGELDARIDHLFHVAAAYHLEVDEDTAWRTNVVGTRNVVEFANAHEVGLFHHTSTNGVAGRHAGPFLESMLNEGQVIDHPYFLTKWHAENVVRGELRRPLRVYRPGVVVGHSATGEMDKLDGAYYFFKPVQQLARVVPRWLPLIGPEGGVANIVPVDFLARAIDHIAHLPDERLRGDTFHLLDNRITVGEAVNEVARAAGGPSFRLRIGPHVTHRVARALRRLPGAEVARSRALARVGIPGQALDWRDFAATFDTTNTELALAGSGIALPPFASYATRLYEYWKRNMDPSRHQVRLGGAIGGKRVLVTGASSGIGRCIALEAGRAGATVLLVARRRAALEELARDIEAHGGVARVYSGDLASARDTQLIVEQVLARHGGVDVLVNNAGRSIRRSIERSYEREHDYHRTMAVNYFGAVRLTLAFLPGMRERGHGHLLHVSSVGLQSNMPRFSAYNASKAAFDAFARSLAPEVGSDGVATTAVYMPLVTSQMSAPTKAFRWLPALTPAQAAAIVCQAMIDKPHRVSTRIGSFAEIVGVVAPRVGYAAMSAELRLLPESAPPPAAPKAESA